MAITKANYNLIKILREKKQLPYCNTILEIGEHNWYGDLNAKVLFDDIKLFAKESQKDDLTVELKSILKDSSQTMLFDIAKIFYKVFFHAECIEAIDLHGTSSAMRLDLNLPHDLGKKYDLIVNLGTAEHVFNVYQVFRSIHEWLKKDGIVFHHLPMYGEVDHGFYNFHPTFYFDLSLANKYHHILIGKATMNEIKFYPDRETLTKDILTMDKERSYYILSLMKKISDKEFQIPRQGFYDDNLVNKKSLVDAWKKQRQISDMSSQNGDK